MNDDFDATIQQDVYRYLLSLDKVDERLPECPDVEDKWPAIAEAYLPDGAREFQQYPISSLGWMMFVGMAIAKYWDLEWEIYNNIDNLYVFMRDKRGYDNLDEYILDEVLHIQGDEREALTELVGECAARCNSALMHLPAEPGTTQVFQAYIACLRTLYHMGMAMQLRAMGYHMTKVN